MDSSSSNFNERFEVATQAECAKFFGLSSRTIQIWISEGCPGQKGAYPLDAMLQWGKNNKWCKSSDPLLAGGDSDNLERYRGVKADLAEIDLQERQGEMVNMTAVRPAFITSLGFMKAAGEQLDRQYGNDALNILLEAWENAINHIKDAFGDDETNE